jgi:hypothetical protein
MTLVSFSRGWEIIFTGLTSIRVLATNQSTPYTEDGDSAGNDNDPNEDIEKQSPLDKLKTTAVYGILGSGLATFALAFAFAPQTLVFVAGAICMAKWVGNTHLQCFIWDLSYTDLFLKSPKHSVQCIQGELP